MPTGPLANVVGKLLTRVFFFLPFLYPETLVVRAAVSEFKLPLGVGRFEFPCSDFEH